MTTDARQQLTGRSSTKYEDWLAEGERFHALEKMAKTHRCPFCGRSPTIPWSAEHNSYILACRPCGNADHFVKAGDDIIERIKDMTGTDEQIQEAINQYLNEER